MSTPGVARVWLERVESIFDRAFGPEWNPVYRLGALGWFFYWIVVTSGIYLYIFFDTGIVDAYASVERITEAQWYAGGVMRSLHRYASDALVVVMVLHLTREYVLGRFRGARWVTWTTGVVVVWLVLAAGVSGYWLVWDTLAQYVAIAVTEWLDVLPLFGEPVARNFVEPSRLSGRFFTLMVFIHIGVPLFLLFAMWIHVHRLTRPRVNPPRGLALGALLGLLGLSLVHPAVSQAPADLGSVPSEIGIDWFYLFGLPLGDWLSGEVLWALAALVTIGLAAMPWTPAGKRRRAAAVVDLDNCNGCGRCVADCPYGAVVMQPRSDGKIFSQEAVVRPELCTACGICAGACPTATPFRRRSALAPGIELPEDTIARLRARTVEVAGGLRGDRRLLVYSCGRGADVGGNDASVGVVTLPCIGMLPPAFVDFVLSGNLVEGVLLTGCREGACHHRFGANWTDARIAAVRDPYLRARVDRRRLRVVWAGVDEGAKLGQALEGLARGIDRVGGAGDEPGPASADAAR